MPCENQTSSTNLLNPHVSPIGVGCGYSAPYWLKAPMHGSGRTELRGHFTSDNQTDKKGNEETSGSIFLMKYNLLCVIYTFYQ